MREEYANLRKQVEINKKDETQLAAIKKRQQEIIDALGLRSAPRELSDARKEHFSLLSKHNKCTVRVGSVSKAVNKVLPHFTRALPNLLKAKEAADCKVRIIGTQKLMKILNDVEVSKILYIVLYLI